MSTSDSNNKVKEVVAIAKSIPIQAYLLFALNVVMLTALVFEDLPLHYVLGLGVFVVCLVETVISGLGCCGRPSQLISQKVLARLNELKAKTLASMQNLRAENLQSSSVNTIVGLLLTIYLASHLNGTLEIFIIVNVVYYLVLLPAQVDSYLGCLSNSCCGLLSKIQYRK